MKKNIWIFLSIMSIAAVVFSLGIGRYAIGLKEVSSIVLAALGMDGYLPAPTNEMQLVFWNIRLPRIVMSFVVGSGISIAGATFQGIFRNPLASPDILGVTSGASFGAALAIVFGIQVAMGIHGYAFIFGVVAVFATYFLGSRSLDKSAAVLVIAGIVISAIFQAGLSVLMYMADPYDQLAKIYFWTMGSFQVASWSKIQITLPIVISGTILLCVFSWRLNIMTLDEEEALSLGVNIFKWRLFYIVISTLIVATSVAAVGSIHWLGLIVPHIARYLVGTEHKTLVPVTAVLGGTFLVLMDTMARSVLSTEIPISIVTSIFGAPFLGYLIMSRKGGALGNDSTD